MPPPFTDHGPLGLPSRIHGGFSRAIYTLDLNSNSFTFSGQIANLAKPFIQDSRAFTLAGQTLSLSQQVSILSTSYGLSGGALTGIFAQSLNAASYITTGQLLSQSQLKALASASFAMAGQILTQSQLEILTSGAFTIAGQAATLTKITLSEMTADAGSFSLAGQAIIRSIGANLLPASYALSGAALAESQAENLVAASYALLGGTLIQAREALLAPNVFFYNGFAQISSYFMPLDPGGYAVAGQVSIPTAGRTVSNLTDHGPMGLPTRVHAAFNRGSISKTFDLDSRSFAITGTALDGRPNQAFSYHSVLGMPTRGYGDFYKAKVLQITLDPRAYILSGGHYANLVDENGQLILDENGNPIIVFVEQNTTLLTGVTTDKPLTLNAGNYNVLGQTAITQRSQDNNGRDFVLTGQPLSLYKPLVNLAPGQFSLSGGVANLQIISNLNASAYSLTGQISVLAAQRVQDANAASYAIAGQPAIFARPDFTLAAGTAMTLIGVDANLQKTGSYSSTLDAAAYSISGQAASSDRVQFAQPASYAITGQPATLRQISMTLAAGSITLTGNAAALAKVGTYTVDLNSTAYSLAGQISLHTHIRELILSANGYGLIGDNNQQGVIVRYIDLGAGTYITVGQPATLATAAEHVFNLDGNNYGLIGGDSAPSNFVRAIVLDSAHYGLIGGTTNLLATVVKLTLTGRTSGGIALKGRVEGGGIATKLRVNTE